MLSVLAVLLMQAAAPGSASQSADASAVSRELRYYPDRALAERVEGVGTLDCGVGPDGALQACVVIAEDPPGWGFGTAAFQLSHLLHIKPTAGGTTPPSGRIRIPIRFQLPPGSGPPEKDPGRGPLPIALGPHFSVSTRPDWKAPPTPSEMKVYYPRAAAKQHLQGNATLQCGVNAFGAVSGCSIVSEDPPGAGFGAAALAMSSTFKMRPATRDGAPITSPRVMIPLNFRLNGRPTTGLVVPPLPSFVVAVLGSKATPLRQIERREIGFADPTVSTERNPPHVGEDNVTARIDLRCHAVGAAAVEGCVVISESPAGSGFGDMSLRIAPRLRVRPTLLHSPVTPGGEFTLPLTYRFVARPMPDPHVFTDTEWVRKPSDREVIYPAGAGGAAGYASLDCVVLAGGALSQCHVRQETPLGLGFGRAALETSRAIAFWPGMVDGQPVDGAKVQVNLRIRPHQ